MNKAPRLMKEQGRTNEEKMRAIYEDIHIDLWEELQRSVVGELICPIDYNSLFEKLRKKCHRICV